MRGATSSLRSHRVQHNISTHAPHAGSDRDLVHRLFATRISTHAPHAGSDLKQSSKLQKHANFNPRSPCGERHLYANDSNGLNSFQPTLPMRGATTCKLLGVFLFPFQPTLPMRGATLHRSSLPLARVDFNPRSPCGERRSRHELSCKDQEYFNPRSPCGERLNMQATRPEPLLFQPTLPMRGATVYEVITLWQISFQPTLPMRGATATYCVAHYIFTRYSQIS